MVRSGLLGSRWLSWLRHINTATVGEQGVLIVAGAGGGHLAASVVGEIRGSQNLVLFIHLGGSLTLSKAVG